MSLSVTNLTGFGPAGVQATVEQVTSGTGTGTTVSVTLPTQLADRFVFVVFAVNGTTENPTTPSGWDVQWANNTTASGDEWHCYSRSCNGTEGSTLSITKSSTNFYAYVCYSFVNCSTGTLAYNLSNDETSTNPTPSLLSPFFPGQAWVTLLTSDQATVSAYPSGTPLFNTQTTGGSASQPMVALAVSHSPALALAAGDWTLATSEACTMKTMSVGNFG